MCSSMVLFLTSLLQYRAGQGGPGGPAGPLGPGGPSTRMSLQVSPLGRGGAGSPLVLHSPFSPGRPLLPRLPSSPGTPCCPADPALPGKPFGPGGPVEQTPLEPLHRSMRALTGTMEYAILIIMSFSSWVRSSSWCLLLRWSFLSSLASAGSWFRTPACSLQLWDSSCI